MADDLLLVGSIPHDSNFDAMNMFGGPLGANLVALPDGEVGWRRFWITRVHFQVVALHPDIEILQRPRRDNGVERIYPHDATDSWNFKVRDGVERIVFGHPGWRLGYYQDAINSYRIFQVMKQQGALPKSLRFQVSIPTAISAMPPRVFPVPGDLEKVRPGYIDAVRAEIQAMLTKIPANELAIQWDCSTELQDVYGRANLPEEGGLERNVPQFHALSKDIPEETAVGVHLCFGTLGGWPRFAPDSAHRAIELANGIIKGAGRRIDWMHIPMLNREDAGYYAPLAKLQHGSTRIFLGMIHNMENFETRFAQARKFLPEFGIGAYCGFGRRLPSELPETLNEHLQAMEVMRRFKA